MVLDVHAARAEALFCSQAQPSEKPDAAQVAESIAAMARTWGSRWCAGQVAQAYGDNPYMAAERMAWARQTVLETYPPRGAR